MTQYRLRWLFYPNPLPYGLAPEGPQYAQSQRCTKCQKGVGAYCADVHLSGQRTAWCPRCRAELVLEPNTGWDHRLWRVWKAVRHVLLMVLDRLHILRRHGHRYGMMCDEHLFVEGYYGNGGFKLKPRRWWEYVIIPKFEMPE